MNQNRHYDDNTLQLAGQLLLKIQEVNDIGNRIGAAHSTLYPYADLTVSMSGGRLLVFYDCEVLPERVETIRVNGDWMAECLQRLDELAELRRKIYEVSEDA